MSEVKSGIFLMGAIDVFPLSSRCFYGVCSAMRFLSGACVQLNSLRARRGHTSDNGPAVKVWIFVLWEKGSLIWSALETLHLLLISPLPYRVFTALLIFKVTAFTKQMCSLLL